MPESSAIITSIILTLGYAYLIYQITKCHAYHQEQRTKVIKRIHRDSQRRLQAFDSYLISLGSPKKVPDPKPRTSNLKVISRRTEEEK